MVQGLTITIQAKKVDKMIRNILVKVPLSISTMTLSIMGISVIPSILDT